MKYQLLELQRRIDNTIFRAQKRRKIFRYVDYAFYLVSTYLAIRVIILFSNWIAHIYDKESTWDSLAFTGSLLGGAITLIGVKIAINNQRLTDYLNAYPLKRKIMDDILEEYWKIADC